MMIQIAATNQSSPDLVNKPLSEKLGQLFPGFMQRTETSCSVAFIGYSTWRREESGDANLFDEQVFVARDGQVRLLNPRYDLQRLSPDGLSWGYSGSGPSQLAIAMLMEILGDWDRVRALWPKFHDLFVAHIPSTANWTADGADILSAALAIERHRRVSSQI
jgi:hypothetical protein